MDSKSTLVLLMALLHLCGTNGINGDGCTFISEDTDTCYMTIECSSTITDFVQKLHNHHCTAKYYRGYGDEYLRNFKLNLTVNNFNFEEVSLSSIINFAPRVKILRIHNATGPITEPIKRIGTQLNEIQLHTDLDTLDFSFFLEFLELKRIDVSFCSILKLETVISPVTTTNSKVTFMDLSYNKIEAIPNNYFLHFPKLKDLNLSHNSIKNLEVLTFEGLHILQNLQLSHNKLNEIGHALARFVNVEVLQVDNNELSSILEPNFISMKMLRRLDISSNLISFIENKSFETLTELNAIDIGNNKLSAVYKWWFANNTNLDTLILSNNNIKLIEKGSFNGKNITKFEIENNCLTGILETDTFEGLHVEILDLSNGNLTQIKDNAFRSSFIHTLNLSSNSIDTISKQAFLSLNIIEKIDISNNFLKDIEFEMVEFSELSTLNVRNNSITEIAAMSFKNLTSLSYLDLSCNSISKVEPHSFNNLINLKILLLNNNELIKILQKDFFQGLSEVTFIDLSFTRITNLQNETLSGLKILQIFNVSHSELSNIDYNVFVNTGSIQVLDFSHNLLKFFHINISTIVDATEIYLNNNHLKQIIPTTFSGLINLQILDLAQNDLEKLMENVLQGLGNLNSLDLSSNTNLEINGSMFSNLTRLLKVNLRNVKGRIDFEHVQNTSINVLDLSHCSIAVIDKIFVFNVANVYNLNVASNKIEQLNKFSFQSMPSLAEIDLSDNFIYFIQPGTFINTNKIKSLNLSRNHLSHLQIGVLDGLQILNVLNLSSNTLREFSSTLLHNTLNVNKVILDNNVLEDFKFSDFFHLGVQIISIGGNQIPCQTLTKMKTYMAEMPISYSINLKVKAEKEDYHSENVDGITCISQNPNTKIAIRLNDTNINSTVIVAALSNAINVFRSSVENLNQNLNNSLHSDGNEHLKILHELSESNNQSRSYLKQLTDIIAATNNHTNHFYADLKDFLTNITLKNKKSAERVIYVNTNGTNVVDEQMLEKIKILNEEKDKIVEELKDMITEFKKDNNHNSNTQPLQEVRYDTGNVTGILYFISVCLLIIIIGIIFKAVYPLVLNRNRLVRNGLHNSVSSTQPISNVLEMH